jgi:gluconokinase
MQTRIIIVMGASGSGKTTIGEALAERMELEFIEADNFHPPANIEKMTGGKPLTDDDRRIWLETLTGRMRHQAEGKQGCVVACSALKWSYREILKTADAGVCFVHLEADLLTLRRRVEDRVNHFMPAGLVTSQVAALEPLRPGEHGYTVDATRAPAEIVEEIVMLLTTNASANRSADQS